MGQYDDLLGEELAGAYNGEKLAKSTKTPRVPDKVEGNSLCVLHNVKRAKTRSQGFIFIFKFTVVKTDSEHLVEGRTYERAFFPKFTPDDQERFWKDVTPLLRAVNQYEGRVADYDARRGIGELLTACFLDEETKEFDPDSDLQFGFRWHAEMEESRPNPKTGVCKHLDKDGKPKWFRRDDFSALTDEELAAALAK